MGIQMLSKSQMNEKKIVKPLDSFFKTENGEPFCFGEFGTYHIKRACSDCKFKKECYKKYEEKN